ncbi:hypothetical protein DL96DRAFT_302037 [Flagelloscypha sp. PMI_526]|nr:hypothetical protein DL96DRAFT_302037 [Flagelloscypha sp. PMI_526]
MQIKAWHTLLSHAENMFFCIPCTHKQDPSRVISISHRFAPIPRVGTAEVILAHILHKRCPNNLSVSLPFRSSACLLATSHAFRTLPAYTLNRLIEPFFLLAAMSTSLSRAGSSSSKSTTRSRRRSTLTVEPPRVSSSRSSSKTRKSVTFTTPEPHPIELELLQNNSELVPRLLRRPPPVDTLNPSGRYHTKDFDPSLIVSRDPVAQAFLMDDDGECTTCGTKLGCRLKLVYSQLHTDLHSDLSFLHRQCEACETVHCAGCFKPTSCPIDCHSSSPLCRVERCCSDARAVALATIVNSFDQRTLAEIERRWRIHVSTDLSSLSQFADTDWEMMVTRCLNVVALYLLPHPYDKSNRLPSHPLVASIIAGSMIPSILHQILQSNVHANQWIDHIDLFTSIILFLHRLKASASLNPGIALLLRKKIRIVEHTCGLEPWLSGHCNLVASRTERTVPMLVRMKELEKVHHELIKIDSQTLVVERRQKFQNLVGELYALLVACR